MSSSSNKRDSATGRFLELSDRITRVATKAIREAAKSSKAASQTLKSKAKHKSK